MATMKELQPITWWLFWRYSVVGLIGGLIVGGIVGFIIGFVIAVFGGSSETTRSITPYAGAAAGLVFSFFLLNFLFTKLVEKTIKGKRLMLVDAG